MLSRQLVLMVATIIWSWMLSLSFTYDVFLKLCSLHKKTKSWNYLKIVNLGQWKFSLLMWRVFHLVNFWCKSQCEVISDQLCKVTDSSSDFHQPPVVAITRHVSICGSGRNCRWKVVSTVHLYIIRHRLCEKFGTVFQGNFSWGIQENI